MSPVDLGASEFCCLKLCLTMCLYVMWLKYSHFQLIPFLFYLSLSIKIDVFIKILTFNVNITAMNLLAQIII